ncbi:MAG: hypothetical protein EBV83_01185 [Verrucomicrobia bacterium]|nr:hypothetical protein [Verrucomicrobiota bacterium]
MEYRTIQKRKWAILARGEPSGFRWFCGFPRATSNRPPLSLAVVERFILQLKCMKSLLRIFPLEQFLLLR